jgi:hypothetical protein
MTLLPGGEGTPARGSDAPTAGSWAGWIPCVICEHTISLDQHRTARCWTDPNGVTCAAHAACLIRVGERDLGLR